MIIAEAITRIEILEGTHEMKPIPLET